MGAINQAEATTQGQIIRKAPAAKQIGYPRRHHRRTAPQLPRTGLFFTAGDDPNKT